MIRARVSASGRRSDGSDANAPSARPARRSDERLGYLHILVLSGLAVAQPLLDLLARNAEFFVARRAGGWDVLGLVFGLLVLLPLPLVVLVAIARRVCGRRLGDAVHRVVIAALAALLCLLILTRAELLDAARWLLAGAAVGVAFAWAYDRFAPVRSLTTYASVALVAIPAAFLFHPRVSKIVFPQARAELHTSGGRSPIVFLVFDELALTSLLDGSRRVDPQAFPNLAAFAGESTWFADARSVSDATELAVPAILTGGFPDGDRLPVLEDYPHNLFTALGGDYRLFAIEPLTRLCPPAVNLADRNRSPSGGARSLISDLWIVYQHLLLPPAYAARLPTLTDRWQGFGQDAMPESSSFTQMAFAALNRDRREILSRFVAALDARPDTALYYLHVLLPHAPWEYLPSGKVYATEKNRIPGLVKERWGDDESFVVQAYRRYLLQLRFLDRWLGELIERLRELDLYDRSLIVLTADHGVSFRPGDSRRLLTDTNATDLVSVPLIIKAPHQRRGEVVDRPVSTIDVLPSVLDLLDVEPPWPLDGRSAFGAGPTGGRRVVGKYRAFELGPSFHRDKYDALEWKLATFGSTPDGADFWRAGTYPELYGEKPAEIGWREQDAVMMHLQGEALLDRHDPTATFSPALISGSLATVRPDEGCCDLAVAINGVVRATVRAHGSPPADLQFSAMVPEDAFRPGENQVEVFRIRRGGSEPLLERLGASGSTAYALQEDAGGRAVAIWTGDRSLPIGDTLRGYLEGVEVATEVAVRGWAANVEASAAPEQLFVFHRGELVTNGFTTFVRPGVNTDLGLAPDVRTGFQLQVPRASVPDIARAGLRLFALSRDAASELGVFYSLEQRGDGQAGRIRATNGLEIPIVASAVAGRVAEVRRDGDRLVLRGWAADLENRRRPARILIFSGGKMSHYRHTVVERPDVASEYAMGELVSSGFELELVHGSAALPVRDLSVFAVTERGDATRLSMP